ncbi:MAG TPA: hypothetical protein VFR63_07570 [Gaiellaceae bacterium]|nr:hypothetical protein [Gaiellaceae bacterium]
MQKPDYRLPGPATALRVALGLFVLAWILGPYELRSAVPVWLAFAVALALEVNFLVGALTRAPAPAPDRGPQEIDRERYGYVHEPDEEDEGIEAEDDQAEVVAERRDVWPPVRRFLVGLGVVAALALLFFLVESRTGWDALAVETRAEAVARFSEEASRLAEKPVRIRCDESGRYVGAVQHADGVAAVGGDLAYLTPERCLDLYRLAFEGEVRGSQTARAVAVLAHETWHLRGVRDEGTTECYALQSGVELGRRLGLPEDTARQLMRQQLAENAGRGGASAEYLVPPECRDGGRLDLDPAGSRFP